MLSIFNKILLQKGMAKRFDKKCYCVHQKSFNPKPEQVNNPCHNRE